MSTAPRLAAAKRDWGHDETGCTVLHIDMDAFYASLEVARNPQLKGKPVIIGTGPRSVVSAASYEARRYGINSAMASARARQLCPNGVFLPVDMAYYRMMSHRIFQEVFSQITDRFEKVSVDEGYMDVSGALLQWGQPSRIGAWIRREVAERYHVTCSVGIAANKLVAKMASTNAKPDGMLLIPLSRHAEFVQMMPLRGIPGIGPSLEKRLMAWGVNSVADLAAMSPETLTRACGSATLAHGLYLASHGMDDRKVTPYTPEKSIGAERTFLEDTRDMRRVCDLLRRCCDEVAASLRHRGLMARTVTVKLRFADLSYATKVHTMERPTDTASTLYPECVRLLRAMMKMSDSSQTNNSHDSTTEGTLPRDIRLAGMSTSGLVEAATVVIQPTLDDLLEESGVAQSSSRHLSSSQAISARAVSAQAVSTQSASAQSASAESTHASIRHTSNMTANTSDDTANTASVNTANQTDATATKTVNAASPNNISTEHTAIASRADTTRADGANIHASYVASATTNTPTHSIQTADSHANNALHADYATPRETKATRLRNAEQALDAVRRKYGKHSASLGL